jgi:CspA family cold shock protein
MSRRKNEPFNPYAPSQRAGRKRIRDSTHINHSGIGEHENLVEVTLQALANPDVKVKIKAPPLSTCREVLEASGLMARDGSPCNCLDKNGRIIDNRSVVNNPKFHIGIPPLVEPVWVEENGRKEMGIGYLQDGTKAYIPGTNAGEFVWVYRCSEWETNNEKYCNASRVRLEEKSPFRLGDHIFTFPIVEGEKQNIYNQFSGMMNKQIEIKVANRESKDAFKHIDWVVQITSINPLKGILLTDITESLGHQPIQVKHTQNSKGNGKIKWCNWKKKFGFIKRDGGGDLWFHFSQVNSYVKLGMNVEFEIVPGKKGLRAININKIK